MKLHQSKQELLDNLDGIVHVEDETVVIEDEEKLEGPAMDALVYSAVLADDDSKAAARWLI